MSLFIGHFSTIKLPPSLFVTAVSVTSLTVINLYKTVAPTTIDTTTITSTMAATNKTGLKGLFNYRVTHPNSYCPFTLNYMYTLFPFRYLMSANCTWSTWTAWNICSKTCDGGTQLRFRVVVQTAQNGGSQCVHPSPSSAKGYQKMSKDLGSRAF